MLNQAPSQSLTRRSRNMLVIGFIISSIAIFLIAVGLFLRLVPTFFGQGTSAASVQNGMGVALLVLGILGFFGGAGTIIRALTRRRENDLAYVTGEYLSQSLDERYNFIRNINQPDLGYIDAVLVGPPGILVFRVLGTEGEVLNEKGGWVKKNRNGQWVPLGSNPTKDAVVDVKAMREFLESHHFRNVDVYGVVVFVKEPPKLRYTAADPIVPVAHLSTFFDVLKPNYFAKERLDANLVDKITKLLLGDN